MRITLSLLALLFAGNFCHAQHITLRNKADFSRTREVVAVPWHRLTAKNKALDKDSLIVRDGSGREIPSQVVVRDGVAESLLFQVDLAPRQSATFTIDRGAPARYEAKVYGRFVPERKDDFAWENNLVAHRIYGPALERTGEISNGIDVWAKRTEKMIIDKWYRDNDYHTDNGEGLDYYKVGRTLGAGAMAPLDQANKIVLARNYVNYRILDRGPLRFTFEVDYAPFAVDGQLIKETRTFSIDADTEFTHITEVYEPQPETVAKGRRSPSKLRVAAGIILRGQKGETWVDDKGAAASYWEPAMGRNGSIGVSVIVPGRRCRVETIDGHLTVSTDALCGRPLHYYMGSAWSKSVVKDAGQWFGITQRQVEVINHPIEITVRK